LTMVKTVVVGRSMMLRHLPTRIFAMTELEQLKSDLPLIRIRAQTVSPDEAASWSAAERARVSCEIRWCVEALAELDARIKAITPAM
jgi:hypothetical protein